MRKKSVYVQYKNNVFLNVFNLGLVKPWMYSLQIRRADSKNFSWGYVEETEK